MLWIHSQKFEIKSSCFLSEIIWSKSRFWVSSFIWKTTLFMTLWGVFWNHLLLWVLNECLNLWFLKSFIAVNIFSNASSFYYLETLRPHRPLKFIFFSLQSPTYLSNVSFFSTWSPTNPMDLSNLIFLPLWAQTFDMFLFLVYRITQPLQTFNEIIFLVLGVPHTPQIFQVFLLFTTWSPTDPADLWNVYIFVVYRVSQTPQTFQMSSFYYLESHRPDRPSIRLILLVLTWSPTNPKDL